MCRLPLENEHVFVDLQVRPCTGRLRCGEQHTSRQGVGRRTDHPQGQWATTNSSRVDLNDSPETSPTCCSRTLGA